MYVGVYCTDSIVCIKAGHPQTVALHSLCHLEPDPGSLGLHPLPSFHTETYLSSHGLVSWLHRQPLLNLYAQTHSFLYRAPCQSQGANLRWTKAGTWINVNAECLSSFLINIRHLQFNDLVSHLCLWKVYFVNILQNLITWFLKWFILLSWMKKLHTLIFGSLLLTFPFPTETFNLVPFNFI